MNIDKKRIGTSGFLLSVVSLAFNYSFGWVSSHFAVCIWLTVTIAHAVVVYFPSVYGVSTAVAVLLLGLLISHFLPPNETEFHGWLTPGNEPTPSENACAPSIPPGSIAVLLGDSGLTNNSPFLVAVSACGHPLLWSTAGLKGSECKPKYLRIKS